jgi:hypothetical protein
MSFNKSMYISGTWTGIWAGIWAGNQAGWEKEIYRAMLCCYNLKLQSI